MLLHVFRKPMLNTF